MKAARGLHRGNSTEFHPQHRSIILEAIVDEEPMGSSRWLIRLPLERPAHWIINGQMDCLSQYWALLKQPTNITKKQHLDAFAVRHESVSCVMTGARLHYPLKVGDRNCCDTVLIQSSSLSVTFGVTRTQKRTLKQLTWSAARTPGAPGPLAGAGYEPSPPRSPLETWCSLPWTHLNDLRAGGMTHTQ